jgi:very-short-patch-repair endonuclease
VVVTTKSLPASLWKREGLDWWLSLDYLATFTILVIKVFISALNKITTTTLAPPFSKGRLGGITLANYRADLKQKARTLRSNMTDAEQKLWYHLRRKQIQNIQFYRQRPIGNYIVDFYAPSIKLIIEIDGAQHAEPEDVIYDEKRTHYLNSLNFNVIRFDNRQILLETNNVLESIHQTISTHNP